ncbi:MAG: SLC13 family permease [Chloroflexi bacterium]|nr:SLC13 family permease [Chloroflexota bacterium]
MLLVFAILGVAMALFASDWLRLDLVALLALLALTLSGLLTPTEALAGFSESVVIMIAGLFVVGAGLVQTGVAAALGTWLEEVAGQNTTVLLVAIMGVAALLSAFMSSTGTTAILLPMVVSVARKARVSPSKLLLPLAYASLIGGVITLIGTPPNMVVSNQLVAAGLPPFGFFDFTPIGLVVLGVGVAFMVVVGRHLLPDRGDGSAREARARSASSVTLVDLAEAYRLPGNLFRLRILSSSPLVGRCLAEADLRARYGVNVLAIRPWQNGLGRAPASMATPDALLRANDLLHVQGSPESVARLAQQEVLALLPSEQSAGAIIPQEVGMAEVLLTPRSRLVGRTLLETRFRDVYQMTVLAIMRMGKPLAGDPAASPLRFGDTLLVQGTWERIRVLQDERQDFVVVGLPREVAAEEASGRRAPLAMAVMLGMLALMITETLAPAIAVLVAAVAMVLTRCVSMEEAYRSINWSTLVLVAAMLPTATALQKTGGVTFMADGLVGMLGALSPLAVMAGLFALTAFLGQFISNTATTVLLAPIAVEVARGMGVAPQGLLMAVAVAASTSFGTPIATPSNTLVLGPGGYRFSDYLKVGLSLQAVLMAATLLALPLLFPW